MIIENKLLLFTAIIENEALADICFLLTSKQTCKQYVQPRNMETRQMTSFFQLFFFEFHPFVA